MIKLLFGGAESTEILNSSQKNISDYSVVSDYGRHLASKLGRTWSGRMTADQMVAFIKENDVDEIVSASHPLRMCLSEAMKAANQAEFHMRFGRQATIDLSAPLSFDRKPLNTSRKV